MSQIKVAKIISAHGIRGSVVLYSFSGKFDWLKKKIQLGAENKDSKLIYNVIDVRVTAKKAIVSFKELTDRTAAEMVIGTELFIDSKNLISKKHETIYLSEILNFRVVDKLYGDLGSITNFSSNGPQDLICIDYTRGDLEVPFVPEIVIEIDFDKKTLFTDLPDQYIETFYPKK